MPKFAISAMVDQFNKQLTAAQRASSLFSEAPVIAGKILRRGSEIVLTEAQYLAQKSKIDAFVKAQAIKIRIISDEGDVKVSMEQATSDTPPAGLKVDPPDVLVPQEVKDEVAALGEEVATEIAVAVEKDIVQVEEQVATVVEKVSKKKPSKG